MPWSAQSRCRPSLYSARPLADRAVQYGEVGAASTAARSSSPGPVAAALRRRSPCVPPGCAARATTLHPAQGRPNSACPLSIERLQPRPAGALAAAKAQEGRRGGDSGREGQRPARGLQCLPADPQGLLLGTAGRTACREKSEHGSNDQVGTEQNDRRRNRCHVQTQHLPTGDFGETSTPSAKTRAIAPKAARRP